MTSLNERMTNLIESLTNLLIEGKTGIFALIFSI